MVFSILPSFEAKIAVVPLVSDPDLCHGADNESSVNTVNSRKVMPSCLS